MIKLSYEDIQHLHERGNLHTFLENKNVNTLDIISTLCNGVKEMELQYEIEIERLERIEEYYEELSDSLDAVTVDVDEILGD